MDEILYITGHKNPDTDSICATLAYAELKNKTGNLKAVPIRLGELNRETAFILNHFGVEPPKLIETVKAQVSDLNIDTIAPVSPEISLKMAWEIIRKNNIKTLPVVDNDNNLIGIVSVTNLTSTFMDIWNSNILSKSGATLENLLDTLSAKVIYQAEENPHFTGKVLVAAMEPASASKMMEQGDIVICGNRDDIQKAIIAIKASLMIVTGNCEVNTEIISLAKNAGVNIISTPYDTYTSARLIPQSIPIKYVMVKDNLIKFRLDDFVEDIKDIMLKTRYRSYPVVDSNNHVVGSVSRYHLISQKKKQVILVDHNEKTQSVEGIEDAEIIEIIDHHRIADIQTGLPIYFRNEPVGSTSTIVASMFFENGIMPSKKIANLLCAAIISDTLLFKSPTSTNIDKIILKRLSELADLDVEEFATEMFKEGTSLKGKSVKDIFYQDFKIFTLNEFKVGISQVGTMDYDGFEPMKEEMKELMEKTAESDHYNILILMLTDILKGGSLILAAGENKEILATAFNISIENGSFYLPGILSRKKQVIPPISNAIYSLK